MNIFSLLLFIFLLGNNAPSSETKVSEEPDTVVEQILQSDPVPTEIGLPEKVIIDNKVLPQPVVDEQSLVMPIVQLPVVVSDKKTSPTTIAVPEHSESGTYYTSAASHAKKYYPENCSAWKELKSENLRSFSSLDELLRVYPNRTLAESCI